MIKKIKTSLYSRVRSFIKAALFILRSGTDVVLRDEGTGLYTRNVFKEMTLKTLESAKRNGLSTSLILADMDGLKKINDTKGHIEGDKMLRLAAEIFENSMRDSDIIGRYGGDEFIALLPGTNSAGAQVVVEKLKKELAKKSLSWSFGAAEAKLPEKTAFFGFSREKLEKTWRKFLEDLIKKADEGVYVEKNKKPKSLRRA
ncbi:MAG: GGDEF domain-containing protein [Parcubacteria group bacterium]